MANMISTWVCDERCDDRQEEVRKAAGVRRDAALVTARRAQAQVTKQLAASACEPAIKALAAAAAAWGEYNAEARAAEGAARGENAASNEYARLRSNVLIRCARR
jgi:hypothetical protein